MSYDGYEDYMTWPKANKPWLSIVLPSIRQQGRENFIISLKRNIISDWDGIKLVIDTEPVKYPVEAINKCYEMCDSEWIWFANDDLTCESMGWDNIFKQCTELFDDGVAMFFIDDKLFGQRFPCFPLVKRELIKDLFPAPYRRYKVDDGIRDIIPAKRIFYLPSVVMRHARFTTEGFGFAIGDGRIYTQVPEDMAYDHRLYQEWEQVKLREKALKRNTNLMKSKLDNPVGVGDEG